MTAEATLKKTSKDNKPEFWGKFMSLPASALDGNDVVFYIKTEQRMDLSSFETGLGILKRAHSHVSFSGDRVVGHNPCGLSAGNNIAHKNCQCAGKFCRRYRQHQRRNLARRHDHPRSKWR
jgi:hypothetical protein